MNKINIISKIAVISFTLFFVGCGDVCTYDLDPYENIQGTLTKSDDIIEDSASLSVSLDEIKRDNNFTILPESKIKLAYAKAYFTLENLPLNAGEMKEYSFPQEAITLRTASEPWDVTVRLTVIKRSRVASPHVSDNIDHITYRYELLIVDALSSLEQVGEFKLGDVRESCHERGPS